MLSTFLLAGCGGSSPVTRPGPSPSGNFTVSVAPSSITLEGGTSVPVSISAMQSKGFSPAITLQVSGLPAGVTASPSRLTLTPATTVQLTLSADLSANSGSATVILTGISGSPSHSAQLALTTIAPLVSDRPPFPTRYVRTDVATLYYRWLNPHRIVYKPPAALFFLTDPPRNRVFALDSNVENMVGSIQVPGAFAGFFAVDLRRVQCLCST
jgi:hypothetical protein